MTSAGTMLARSLVLGLVWALCLVGCAGGGETLESPWMLRSPYPPVGGDRLFAVVPLRNESGTSSADVLRIADALSATITEAEGLRALPTNRVLDAMRALEIGVLDDPSQARALSEALGVDALVLGSLTAYDPYDPPVLGLSLAIYERRDTRATGSGLDPRVLSYQGTEYAYFPRSSRAGAPSSSVALHLDGRNHAVQQRVRAYARGRHDEDSALGWRRYLASMDLYERFAAHAAIGELLERERRRLQRAARGTDG